jgi:hypothetical protein
MAISRIDSDGIVSGGITADSLNIGQIGGRRNIVYNGAMTVWQRGTSADTASDQDYTCDRWMVRHSGLDGNVDWDQETSSTPDGFGYALKISTDASETSLDAADYVLVQQRFEGQDLQQLQKGTSGAKSLTVSFWVKSSVASTYTAELFDVDNTRTISKSYAINTADTWEFKTLTFEGDTTGALTNDNGESLRVEFWIDAGSDYTSGTFNTAWQANDNTERVYDTTGWLESASPEFYITGVQLEVGSVATPFEHRSYGEELALCQRYFEVLGYGCIAMAESGSTYVMNLPYRVTKRSAATIGLTITSNLRLRQFGVADRDAATPSAGGVASSTTGGTFKVSGFAAIGASSTPAGIGFTTTSEDGNAFFASAEL